MAAEKTFENKIKKFIEGSGGWQVKFFANRMTRSGIPDILSCINGYFVGIEVKGPNGTPSELQKYHRDKINKSNGIAIILYPQDYDLFKELVKCLNKCDETEAWRLAYEINKRSA